VASLAIEETEIVVVTLGGARPGELGNPGDGKPGEDGSVVEAYCL
jgi:hypothetical protein